MDFDPSGMQGNLKFIEPVCQDSVEWTEWEIWEEWEEWVEWVEWEEMTPMINKTQMSKNPAKSQPILINKNKMMEKQPNLQSQNNKSKLKKRRNDRITR